MRAGRTATDDGVWTSEHGSGRTVVLVHGTMDRSTSFARVVRVLDEMHVVRYDRRGYGRSLGLGPPRSFDQQADDLADVIGDCGAGRPVVVAGHSYGGTVALATAARYPNHVAGLVVYECPLPWMDWWPRDSAGARAVSESIDPADAAERFMRRMLGDDRWERLPPSTRKARRSEGATLVAETRQLRDPARPPFEMASVRCPVIAAHGARGVAHHARSIATIAAHVTDARRVEVDDAGHGVHLTHPADFAGLIRSMVEETSG